MPSSTKRTVLWALFVLWLLVYLASFYVYQTTEPTGSSFTRGFNRISGFLAWQLSAAVVGVPVFLLGRMYPSHSLASWFTRLPLALAALIVVIPVGFFALGWLANTVGFSL